MATTVREAACKVMPNRREDEILICEGVKCRGVAYSSRFSIDSQLWVSRDEIVVEERFYLDSSQSIPFHLARVLWPIRLRVRADWENFTK